MGNWVDLPVTVATNDVLSGSLTSNLGVEQYFATRPLLSVSTLLIPRKFRSRDHLSFTATAGTLGLMLQIRKILGTGISNGVIQNPNVIGDSGKFNVISALLPATNAQVKLEHIFRLKVNGTAGSSAYNAQGDGNFYPASGQSPIGITMPLNLTDITTLDCTQAQYVFLGVTFSGLLGTNTMMYNGASVQFTEI